jgi:hypothetical protein
MPSNSGQTSNLMTSSNGYRLPTSSTSDLKLSTITSASKTKTRLAKNYSATATVNSTTVNSSNVNSSMNDFDLSDYMSSSLVISSSHKSSLDVSSNYNHKQELSPMSNLARHDISSNYNHKQSYLTMPAYSEISRSETNLNFDSNKEKSLANGLSCVTFEDQELSPMSNLTRHDVSSMSNLTHQSQSLINVSKKNKKKSILKSLNAATNKSSNPTKSQMKPSFSSLSISREVPFSKRTESSVSSSLVKSKLGQSVTSLSGKSKQYEESFSRKTESQVRSSPMVSKYGKSLSSLSGKTQKSFSNKTDSQISSNSVKSNNSSLSGKDESQLSSNSVKGSTVTFLKPQTHSGASSRRPSSSSQIVETEKRKVDKNYEKPWEQNMKKKISSEEKETLRKFSQRKNYLLYH